MPHESPFRPRKAYEAVTLLASTTVTADANHDAVRVPYPANGIVFVLDVTDKQTDVSDLADVFVQTLIDGTNWVDIVHFTQLVGNGTDAARHVAKICCAVAQAEFEVGTALGAAAVRHLFGDAYRVRSDITDGGGGGATSFTYGVTAIPV